MKNQLTGKIVWIPFDSQFLGRPKIEKENCIVAKLDYFIKDSNIIKFSTYSEEENWHFDINLINQNDIKYTGKYTDSNDPHNTGDIDCELFENRNELLLIGIWQEDITYTFWAKIPRK